MSVSQHNVRQCATGNNAVDECAPRQCGRRRGPRWESHPPWTCAHSNSLGSGTEMSETMIAVKDWVVSLHPVTELATRIKQGRWELMQWSCSRKFGPHRALWRSQWVLIDRAPLELAEGGVVPGASWTGLVVETFRKTSDTE